MAHLIVTFIMTDDIVTILPHWLSLYYGVNTGMFVWAINATGALASKIPLSIEHILDQDTNFSYFKILLNYVMTLKRTRNI